MPTTKNGHITIRAKSEDPIDFFLWDDDGVEPVDLSNRSGTGFKLIIVDFETGVEKTSFAEGSKLVFIDSTDKNHIQLRQKKEDFPAKAEYGYYFIVYDLVGEHPIPDGLTPDLENYYHFNVI